MMRILPKSLGIYQVSFALVGGILMGLTPSPVEAYPLAWIGLVPLWLLVTKVEPFSLKRCLLVGGIWAGGYHGLALFWITGIHPMTWLGVPWLPSLLIAGFCWLFITFWGVVLVALWSGILGWLKSKLELDNSFVIVLIGVALWCGLETLWNATPLWWTSLAYTQSPHNLIILQLGKLSGPATVTAVIVMVNGLLAEAIAFFPGVSFWLTGRKNVSRKKYLQFLVLAIIAVVIGHGFGFFSYTQNLEQPQKQQLKVGIIQGNIPNEIKFDDIGWRKALEGYTTGYKELANQGVEAILTPEISLPFVWSELSRNRRSFYRAILEEEIPAWVGAFGSIGNSFTNSLFSISSSGEVLSRYDKSKLVPLGEYIPFESILGKLIDRLSPLEAHLVAGKPNQIFTTPFGRAIVGICYESAFSDIFRRQAQTGGQFILSPSNDAHYSPAMPAQHHAQDVMRAIETDRWAVRATNTGYSAIVDPHGNTIWQSSLNQYAIHAATIYRRTTATLYVRWGNWLTWILLLGAGLACLFQVNFWSNT